jgi:hypothetical protein
MSSRVSTCKRLGLLACLGALPLLSLGEARFDLQGGEYPIVGNLQGDQVFAQIAANQYGGYLVWQDNATDGDGSGISARRINRTFSGSLGVFRVNQNGAGDQTLPQVALLANGGAVFVWQSLVGGSTRVYGRFLNADGTFATGDVAISSYTRGDQTEPVVTSLNDGTVVVAWTSIGQERYPDGRVVPGGMQGVFAQRFSQTGGKLGTEFQVNTTSLLNQRSPTVAALANGNFVVVWVSEVYKGLAYNVNPNGAPDPGAGVEVFDVVLNGQVFDTTGIPIGGELPLTSNAFVCANPAIASTPTGFTVAWSGRPNHALTQLEQDGGWDVFARVYALDGTAPNPEFRLNSYTYGDQYRPRLAFQDGIHLVLWSSLGQDGSFEGVIGRLLNDVGDHFMSTEFRVNTTTISRQMYPTVAPTGAHTFMTVWSSFIGGVNSFDLFAQRYSSTPEQTLAAPSAPYVSALSQSKLSVTWPALSGYDGAKYNVYVDGSSTPVVADNDSATVVGLQPASTHSFQLAYVLADGRVSPLSAPASGTTWGEDNNFDGLPDDWEAKYFGNDPSKWPSANADSDGDGATNLQEFLAGTDPTDPNSVLRTRMLTTSQGPRLEWSTQPGNIYQVQVQGATPGWTSIGTPRFAADQTDSIPLITDQSVALFRVIRVR